MSSHVAFVGSVPRTYHALLVPLIFEGFARDMARRLGVRPRERVLELACGTGIVTREIAATMDGGTLLATDLNPAMLDVARAELEHVRGVEFQVVDACDLPFEDRSFDVLACQFGVMFFSDKVKAMREARRVLVPGGRYVFNVWDSLEHNPIPRAVQEVVTAMYPDNPPTFLRSAPYGWSDRGEIERVVRAGGFDRCEIVTVSLPCSAPSAEDAARAYIEGTPLLGSLTERGVTDLAPVRREIASVLGARFGTAPCVSTMRAVVVILG